MRLSVEYIICMVLFIHVYAYTYRCVIIHTYPYTRRWLIYVEYVISMFSFIYVYAYTYRCVSIHVYHTHVGWDALEGRLMSRYIY